MSMGNHACVSYEQPMSRQGTLGRLARAIRHVRQPSLLYTLCARCIHAVSANLMNTGGPKQHTAATP